MRIPPFSLVALIALLCASQLFAAYGKGELIMECNFAEDEISFKDLLDGSVMWEKDSGMSGGGALHLKSSSNRGTRNYPIPLDAQLCRGKTVMLEVHVKGLNLEQGERRHFKPNFMLYVKSKSAKKIRWAKVPAELGSYDWKHFYKIEEIPEDLEEICIILVLQQCMGEAWIDRVALYETVIVPDSKVVKPFNAEAAKIRRGEYTDPAKDNRNGFRGFMSGHDMSEEAIRQLESWGANIVRYQMNPKRGRDTSTPEKYLAWIDEKIEEAETIRERCLRHGIQIVLDLHRAPGGVKSKHASNMITADTNLDVLEETWIRIATHFKDKPGIYGYDLLNEPAVNSRVWMGLTKRLICTIRKVDPATPIIVESTRYLYNEYDNIIYGPHFYSPHDLTHQGVGRNTEWKYPGYINGVYWDKEQIRLALKPTIDFQKKHNAKIYIGEFSCIAWAKGCDQWVKDVTEIFDEYGFDYTYHAFREWEAWSIEYEYSGVGKKLKKSENNGRKRALLKSFERNRRNTPRSKQ